MKSSKMDETLDYVRKLETGNHGVFFYRSPHEKQKVLFNFLAGGLRKGMGAIYVASQETPQQIRRRMKRFGLNVEGLEKDCVLRVFDCHDWYMRNGEIDIPHTRMMGKYVLNEALEIGLKGLRICGEMACFFQHRKENELVEHELSIGRKLDFPIAALCSYDVNHIQSHREKLFFNVIKAHGPVVTSTFAQEVRFETLFSTITSEVLEDIFGDTGKEAILRILEQHRSFTLQKIGEDHGSFIQRLHRLLGSGAETITKTVATQMQTEMGITQ